MLESFKMRIKNNLYEYYEGISGRIEYYILARFIVNNGMYICLICLEDGNRYTEPVHIGNKPENYNWMWEDYITSDAWYKVTGGVPEKFIKVDTVKYVKKVPVGLDNK